MVVEPLVAWMWAGGLLIGLGGLLAVSPGERRRPTDPVSGAPMAREVELGGADPPRSPQLVGVSSGGRPAREREGSAEPVGTPGR